MSKYLDDYHESNDIDALNDETFGCCGIDDINNDWEEEHEKFVETSSSQFIDTGSLLETVDPSNDSSFAQYHFSKLEFFNDSLNNNNNNNKQQNSLNDDIFPNCADITKSVLDVVSDNEDFLIDIYSCFSSSFDNDVQNGVYKNTKSTKEKAKNIDLESLRPPSPSILPVDLTFMSKVWRPPSPDISPQTPTHNNHQQQTPKELSKSSTPVPTQPTIPLDNNQINIFSAKVIRLEDLEAEMKSPVNFSSPNNSSNNHNQMKSNLNTSEPLIDLSNLSFNQLSMKNPAVIPGKNMKIVQPPPGFSTKLSELALTPPPTLQQPMEPKILPIKQITHANAKLTSPPVHMESFLNLMNCFPKMLNLNYQMEPSTVTLEQQRVMNKIITPAQAQRSYRHMNNFTNRNQDKYSGFMTQKEKDWLIKVFRIQCKVNDPYVEDYYEVNYMLKKNSLNRIAKQKELMINDGGLELNESTIKDAEPVLVLPQLAHVEDSKPKYIQFDNALGKIQVLNSKCPRKLVEFNNETFKNYKLDLKSQYLLKIERLYEHFLNIEDEDKRMPILPDNVKQQHVDKRMQLCTLLFNGLTVSLGEDGKNDKQYFTLIQRSMLTLKRISVQVDPQLLKINKGLYLVIRSLSKLEDEQHLIVLISSLLIGEIFQRILEVENEFKFTIGNIITKAISQIQTAKSLIYITSCIDNANIFTDNKYGSVLLVSLFKQYELSEDKLMFLYYWVLFVNTLMKHIPETSASYNICNDHLIYLNHL